MTLCQIPLYSQLCTRVNEHVSEHAIPRTCVGTHVSSFPGAVAEARQGVRIAMNIILCHFVIRTHVETRVTCIISTVRNPETFVDES